MAAVLNLGALASAGPTQTMGSREIADLTGSTHDNVLKTVRRLVAEGVVSGNETPYQHPQNGQTYNEFRLSFRDTMVVVSGYSAELRSRIIDRWMQLEQQAAPLALDLRDPRHLAPLALQLVTLVQEQQAQLEAAAPKVAFAEQVAASSDDRTISEAAKELGTGQRRLFALLRSRGILLANNLPAQSHLDRGRFRVVERPWTDDQGNARTTLQTRVTARGLTYLSQLLAQSGEPQGA